VAFDAGFQLVAVSGASSNAQVGTFINATAAPFTRINMSDRLTHADQAPIISGTVSWNFRWVAPSNSPPGQVYFYYATNSVNDNNDTSGDTPRNGVSSSVPLPIDLVSFGVEREDNYVQFEWTTQTEKNADRFEIESSADGRQFQVLGSENATGNSDKPQNYSTKIFNELHDTYFRLKMIDLDGSYRYSEIIYSKPKAVLPKVHTGNNAITVSFPEEVTATMDVYNLMGRTMMHEAKDNTNFWTFDTHHYPKGVYVVRISGHDVEKLVQKFVVQ